MEKLKRSHKFCKGFPIVKFLHLITNSLFSRDVVLTLIGAATGWAISHFYFVQSLADMKTDAIERKRIEELMLRGIESVGAIKYQRDASGKITGVVIELKGAATASATASGSLQTNGAQK